MNPLDQIVQVDIRVEIGGRTEPIRKVIAITDLDMVRSMMPKPKDHDLPPGFPRSHQAYIDDAERAETRRLTIQIIAQTLAKSLVEAIEEQDPVRGYRPGEPGYEPRRR